MSGFGGRMRWRSSDDEDLLGGGILYSIRVLYAENTNEWLMILFIEDDTALSLQEQ